MYLFSFLEIFYSGCAQVITYVPLFRC